MAALVELTADDVEQTISVETRRVLEATAPAVAVASVDDLRDRLRLAREGADRDVAVVTSLQAEGAAGLARKRIGRGDRALLARLRIVAAGTAWLGALPERRALDAHIAALEGGA